MRIPDSSRCSATRASNGLTIQLVTAMRIGIPTATKSPKGTEMPIMRATTATKPRNDPMTDGR